MGHLLGKAFCSLIDTNTRLDWNPAIHVVAYGCALALAYVCDRTKTFHLRTKVTWS
jgi:hypothetical protein